MVKPCKIAASLSSLSTVIRTGVSAPTGEVGIPIEAQPVQVEVPPADKLPGDVTQTYPAPVVGEAGSTTGGNGQQGNGQQGNGQQGEGQQQDDQQQDDQQQDDQQQDDQQQDDQQQDDQQQDDQQQDDQQQDEQGQNGDNAAVTNPSTGGGVDTGNCDCYAVEGKDVPTYYKNYKFIDFRSLSQYAAAEPAHIEVMDEHFKAPLTSEYFTSGEFSENFYPMNWNRTSDKGFFMTNSYSNLYISQNDAGDSETFLRMRSARATGDWQSAAEFEFKDMIEHGSMRMYSRLSGDKGACGAMFTYWASKPGLKPEDNPKDVQESDIEMLTKENPKIMHYVNHGKDKKYHEKPKMKNAPGWDNFIEHRLDWTPGQTTWYVNSEELKSTSRNTPTNPSKLIFNMWGEDADWTGLMPENGAAHQDIQWIEVAHGVTEEGQCSNVCKVENGQPGKPVAGSATATE